MFWSHALAVAPSGPGGSLLDELLADPPRVHALGDEEAVSLATDRDCYELIVQHCARGSTTLETGAGLSTALFAALGTCHTCVTPSQDEVTRVLDYCTAHAIPADDLSCAVAYSADALPGLAPEPLDLVLIDGAHGFPTPIIDWFYTAGRLRQGGIVVLDDLQLPAVRMLVDFLEADPRWRRVARTEKWGAWSRETGGPVNEDWVYQPFLALPGPPPGPARAWLERHVPDLVPVLRPLARIARRARSAVRRP